MYIMCPIIFEEKAEIQNQYPLSLNPVQKATILFRMVTELLMYVCASCALCCNKFRRISINPFWILNELLVPKAKA